MRNPFHALAAALRSAGKERMVEPVPASCEMPVKGQKTVSLHVRMSHELFLQQLGGASRLGPRRKRD